MPTSGSPRFSLNSANLHLRYNEWKPFTSVSSAGVFTFGSESATLATYMEASKPKRTHRPFVIAFSAAAALACGSSVPPPIVGASPRAQELAKTAGPTVQDCGEATESREASSCKVQPVGECMLRALKNCRAARGAHVYSTGEGDAVRVDWFVVERSGGSCEFVTIEDRTRDLLGPKAVEEKVCKSASWTRHPRIPDCEVLMPLGCQGPQPNAAPP